MPPKTCSPMRDTKRNMIQPSRPTRHSPVSSTGQVTRSITKPSPSAETTKNQDSSITAPLSSITGSAVEVESSLKKHATFGQAPQSAHCPSSQSLSADISSKAFSEDELSRPSTYKDIETHTRTYTQPLAQYRDQDQAFHNFQRLHWPRTKDEAELLSFGGYEEISIQGRISPLHQGNQETLRPQPAYQEYLPQPYSGPFPPRPQQNRPAASTATNGFQGIESGQRTQYRNNVGSSAGNVDPRDLSRVVTYDQRDENCRGRQEDWEYSQDQMMLSVQPDLSRARIPPEERGAIAQRTIIGTHQSARGVVVGVLGGKSHVRGQSGRGRARGRRLRIVETRGGLLLEGGPPGAEDVVISIERR